MESINQIKKNDFRYDSITATDNLNAYKNEINNGLSQRQAAKKSGIPISTLRDLSRVNENNFDLKVVEFIRSPEGFVFLHRLFMTMILQFVIPGFCGIRQFTAWLKISGLSNFIASSYSTWQEVVSNMEDKILTFEKDEREKLSKNMPEKKISLAIDETFFKKMCLVGVEPVSNFIFVEQYSDKRDAESWYNCITSNSADLKVKIVQIIGDQASGIISVAKNMFSSHYATDLFHIQREICKAGSIKIANQVRVAEDCVIKQSEGLEKIKETRSDLINSGFSTKSIDLKIKNETKKLNQFQIINDENKGLQKKFKINLMGLSSALHPVNKITGVRKGVSLIEAEVSACLYEIKEIFSKIDLNEKSYSYFKKAEKAIPYLLSSISFFCTSVNEIVRELRLTKEQEYSFHSNLVSAAYLRRISKYEKSSDKIKIKNRADELEKKGLELFAEDQRENILKSAKDAANMYQRSSSVVEGRNSSLSLKNHSMKRLTSKRLSVLTIIQNYYVKNTEGTTAAERFFEQAHSNLSDYIIENVLPAPRAYFKKLVK